MALICRPVEGRLDGPRHRLAPEDIDKGHRLLGAPAPVVMCSWQSEPGGGKACVRVADGVLPGNRIACMMANRRLGTPFWASVRV